MLYLPNRTRLNRFLVLKKHASHSVSNFRKFYPMPIHSLQSQSVPTIFSDTWKSLTTYSIKWLAYGRIRYTGRHKQSMRQKGYG